MQGWLFVVAAVLIVVVTNAQLYQYGKYNLGSRRSRFQQLFNRNYFRRSRPTVKPTVKPSILEKYSKQCGKRHNSYRPDQKARRGRIVWTDADSSGANAAPDGSFPWMASLFLRQATGEAYFMCAATIITPKVLVSAAHCFKDEYRDTDWFVRVGDNYIVSKDPSEQTFQVSQIVRHEGFLPLSSPGGDGRNDIALLTVRPRQGKAMIFDNYVSPACLPAKNTRIKRWEDMHCEIGGWGMQEYNNTASYPDSARAARIQVNSVSGVVCDYLYGRDVWSTGKFCAGGSVDACQEDSGGPLVCQTKGRYHLVGIISSGKGCGSYPGLYTDVSRYYDWIKDRINILENEV